MGIAEELKKLHDLHARGALTDEEYARAKEAVLDGTAPLAAEADDDYVLPPPVGRPADESPRYVNLRTVTTVATIALFAAVFLVVFLPRLEKGWDNLNRFRSETDQRKQIQGQRGKTAPAN